MDEPFTERELYMSKLLEMSKEQIDQLSSTMHEVRRVQRHTRILLLAVMTGVLRQLEDEEIEQVIEFLNGYVKALRDEMSND